MESMSLWNDPFIHLPMWIIKITPVYMMQNSMMNLNLVSNFHKIFRSTVRGSNSDSKNRKNHVLCIPLVVSSHSSPKTVIVRSISDIRYYIVFGRRSQLMVKVIVLLGFLLVDCVSLTNTAWTAIYYCFSVVTMYFEKVYFAHTL